MSYRAITRISYLYISILSAYHAHSSRAFHSRNQPALSLGDQFSHRSLSSYIIKNRQKDMTRAAAIV